MSYESSWFKKLVFCKVTRYWYFSAVSTPE